MSYSVHSSPYQSPRQHSTSHYWASPSLADGDQPRSPARQHPLAAHPPHRVLQSSRSYTHYPPAMSAYEDHSAYPQANGAPAPDPLSPLIGVDGQPGDPTSLPPSAHPSRAPSPATNGSSSAGMAYYGGGGGVDVDALPIPSGSGSATGDIIQQQQQQQQAPPLAALQWTPQRGDEGTQVTVVLSAAAAAVARSPTPPSDFPPPSSPSKAASSSGSSGRRFQVVFGAAVGPTKYTRAERIDGNGVGQSMIAPGGGEDEAFVVLTAFAPARSAMGRVGEQIHVVVRVVDEEGRVVDSETAGEWDSAIPATPIRVNHLKRQGDDLVSDREAPGTRSPVRPVHNSPMRPQGDWGASPNLAHLAIPQAEHSPALTHSSALSYPAPPPPPPAPHSLAAAAAPSYDVVDPALEAAPAPPPPPPAGLPQLINRQPELIRTSQIHAPKNGYGASYSHKVILKLSGDLNTMAMGWSNDEWMARRRLIQFWPQQDGNEINVAFRPITQAEYQQNSIVISCIFRDEWNECFVTSVDTIYLLEALVGSRFTVEEKNRIRRNLEGFKPMTVSKAKPEAENFFKLIMSFPNPKPRNIEKDVKVFPWKILANALKKIMSKYSANYPLGPDGTPLPPGAQLHAPSTSTSDASGAGPALQPPPPPQQPSLPQPSVSQQQQLSPHLGGSLSHAQQQPHSPHLLHASSAHAPSPHLSHAHLQQQQQQQQQSPHVAHSSPHLGVPSHLQHQHQQHSHSHSAYSSPNPNLAHSHHHSHSPAHQSGFPDPSTSSSAYTHAHAHAQSSASQSAYAAVTDPALEAYSNYYATPPGAGAGGHLFPAHEDYGVAPSHSHSHAHSELGSNHLRSFSEGVNVNVNVGLGGAQGAASYVGYATSPALAAGGWGQEVGGEGGGGEQ